jgi:hypothetical protein
VIKNVASRKGARLRGIAQWFACGATEYRLTGDISIGTEHKSRSAQTILPLSKNERKPATLCPTRITTRGVAEYYGSCQAPVSQPKNRSGRYPYSLYLLKYAFSTFPNNTSSRDTIFSLSNRNRQFFFQ